MKKAEIMALIITKLRGKQNAYTVFQISQSIANLSDDTDLIAETFHFLTKEKIILSVVKIKEVESVNEIEGTFYYLSEFYRQALKESPQTESIIECRKILFPEGEKEIIQTELFKI